MNALINQEGKKSQIVRQEEIFHCRALLQKMANNWHKRAQVKGNVGKLNQPEDR